jgi:hypothetical protein
VIVDESVTGLKRIFLAFAAFFAVLFDRAFASAVARLRAAQAPGVLAPGGASASLPAREETRAAPDALQLLAVFQRDGRLIDFLQEDLAAFSDADIGAAARTVHTGCRKVLDGYLKLEHVYGDPEGASVTLQAGFDPSRVRLTGNVVGSPPFKGILRHPGWRISEVTLPSRPDGQDPTILAPAEVDLP